MPVNIIAGQRDSGPAADDGTKNIITGIVNVVIGSNKTEIIAAIKPNQSFTTLNIIQPL